jgi:ferric enterobactin receptor
MSVLLNMNKKLLVFVVLIVVFSFQLLQGQNYSISGHIYEDGKQKKPLFLVAVFIKNTNKFTTTDENGFFKINSPGGEITICTSILGYERTEDDYFISADTTGLNIYLKELNLALDEVVVTAQSSQSKSGSSTYKIGEQAIKQIQPLSAGDILQLLPGASVSNPDLNSVSQANLRNVATSSTKFSEANSFGTSVIIDGAQLSNDANMQASNPSKSTFGGNNVVNRGVDLRQIPASNIESVEIVQGVANVKYGNLTSGAIIIKRKAGYSPWNINFNAFPNTYQAGFSKGFVTKKIGSVNTNFDYAFSNASPISKKYFYQRINFGLRWSDVLNKEMNWTNTLSFDFGSQTDGIRFEPEEVVYSFTDTENSNYILNNFGSFDLFGRVSYTINASYSHQYTYSEQLNSDGPLPLVESTEAGTYRGGFTPLAYTTALEMIGAPLSLHANIEQDQNFRLKGFNFDLNYGFDYNFNKNYGSGRSISGDAVSIDAYLPGVRGAKFHELPASVTYSGYFQNDLSKSFKNQSYLLKTGIRYDNMIGIYNLLSPRLTFSAKYFNSLRLRAAWGLSYKAPAMLTLYPGPIYTDISNFSWYPNNPLERLAIVTTFVHQPINENLKPSKGETYEYGVDWEKGEWNFHLTFFRKFLTNGIATENHLRILPNQSYKVIDRPDDLPPVVEPDTIANYPHLYYLYKNNLFLRTDGIEFSASLPRIKATNTRITFNGAYNKSFSKTSSPSLGVVSYITEVQENRFGVYEAASYTNEVFRSNITIVQHMPLIRLLVTLRVENKWINKRSADGGSIYPYAYYDKNGNYYEIPEGDRNSPEYDNLVLVLTDYEFFPQPSYSNFHLQIRKESMQGHSFSFYANNFWWHNPTYYDPIELKMIRLNGSLSFGFGVTFKI